MSDESLASPSASGSNNGTRSQTPSPTAEPPSRPSSSRAIVPTPITTNITPKAAATASSPASDYANPSPVGGGPTSASYVVPPRPKPGRKPATDEPASKRKAQNRESQRAFRARKAAKVSELQAQVDSTEQKHRKEVGDKIAELNQRDIQIRELNALVRGLQETERRTATERDYWKGQAARYEAQNTQLLHQLKARGGSISTIFASAPFFPGPLPTSRQDFPRNSISSFSAYETPKNNEVGCGNCKLNGECPCMDELANSTPSAYMAAIPFVPVPRTVVSPMKDIEAHTPPVDPASIFADREIDFTAQYSTKRPRLDPRPPIAFLTQANESDSRCGFCTDESNCLCRIQGDQIILPRDWSRTKPTNDSLTTGPGTCDDCQANPQQKAWCQRVAQLRNTGNGFTSRPSSRTSSIGSGIDPFASEADMTLGKFSIGCSDTFKLLDGRVPMESDQMDWVNSLKPLSPHTIRKDTLPTLEPQRKYSALELDTASVIVTLQQSMAPLVPRPSDGPNADLVRIAQASQLSTSASPSL